jgi:Fe2+ transport system protein B
MGGDTYNELLSEYGVSQINKYYDIIDQNVNLQNLGLSQLENKNQELLKKQEIQLNQLKEIEDKEKLLLTRSRMLQIAQDRNSYKKKIIYSLLALIFGIFILTIVMYVLFKRKMTV